MLLSFLNLIAFTLMIVVNVLSMQGIIGGIPTAGVSKEFDNVLTPAGWTFSIWAVIYALLLIFIIGGFATQQGKHDKYKVGHMFWISCLFNMAWLYTWQYKQIWLSMLLMAGLLVSLIIVYNRIGSTKTIYTAGFNVYLGWIIVATIANFTVMMVSFGLDGFGSNAQIWTTAVLPLAALILSAIVYFRKDWILGATAIFAYLGIISRQIMPKELNGGYAGVVTAAAVGFVLLLVATVFNFTKERKVVVDMTK